MKTIWDLEILMMVPINIVIEYPDEFDDNYFENRLFRIIRDYLNIEIDVCSILNHIGRREKGSVSIYYSNDSFNKYILFDTYIGDTDQLSIINIGFSCPSSMGVELRNLVRQFYDESCEYNIYYCEGTNPIGYKYKNNFSLFNNLNKEKNMKIS